VCAPPCTFTNMYFGPPVTGNNNPEASQLSKAIFYFRRTVKNTEEYIRYNLLSLLAEIGGYTGLLLGYSVLNVTQIFDPILDCLGSLCNRKVEPKKEEERIIEVRERKTSSLSSVSLK